MSREGETLRGTSREWHPPRFGRNVNGHRCDVCGDKCAEVFYEFRCFKRLLLGSDESRSAACTALSPTRRRNAKRGGLLGVHNELSKVRETFVYR